MDILTDLFRFLFWYLYVVVAKVLAVLKNLEDLLSRSSQDEKDLQIARSFLHMSMFEFFCAAYAYHKKIAVTEEEAEMLLDDFRVFICTSGIPARVSIFAHHIISEKEKGILDIRAYHTLIPRELPM